MNEKNHGNIFRVWSAFKMEGKAEREEELAEVLRGVAGGVAVSDHHHYDHIMITAMIMTIDHDAEGLRGVAGGVAVR